ncbi:ATP-binding protein [Sphingobium sp. D43FB]|uniref:ATP-binding protein n=1 Tax=Sphingobium sp. D43FB TaxID=2017595 RepID=UPI000BB57CEC|nr:ATP-binding protein [Sphingobium sp. D43FB]PBN42954.1 ATP-binding protein [Sphingobium sp. D43FB]
MSLPSVVRSQVDRAAVTKVTRLFNNTIGDVLAELIQNARRATATSVMLQTSQVEDGVQLSVSDDGVGIDDPTVVLALGRSGWTDSVARREDPAGMGVFSLAGRHVSVRSRPRAAELGWQIDIAAHAWEDGSPIPVASCDRPIGTEIVLSLDKAWSDTLDAAARAAARHCPIPVFLNGEELKRLDWLDGACAIYREGGVRIGVFDDRRANVHSHSINFHGVTVGGGFPSIVEKHGYWCARVDITDAPALQLVLPARKEMVENEALARLRREVRRAIYRFIATRPAHRLAYDEWCEAAELGISLPEAVPLLTHWEPASADVHVGITPSEIEATEGLFIVEGSIPAIEQSAHLALSEDKAFEGRLVAPDPKMVGYDWYDRLSRITGMAFEIELNGETMHYNDAEFPGLASGPVDAARLVLTITGPSGDTSATITAPAVIEYDDSSCWDVEEAAVIIASPEAVTAEDIVDLLEGTCFSPSEDRDADSWDTQHDRFLLDAREIAICILHGDDAAILERLRTVLSDRVQWFVPEGRQFRAVIGRNGLEIAMEPAQPAQA